jgi:small subunit ribosomal protein S9
MKDTKSPHLALSVGKRKTSIARVWIVPGNGTITVNKLPCEEYFSRSNGLPTTYSHKAFEPIKVTATEGKFSAICTVKGGGLTGQAEAVRHGIAKALDKVDGELRPILRAHCLLTRDSRKVERKKYGKHKARKSTQYSKR